MTIADTIALAIVVIGIAFWREWLLAKARRQVSELTREKAELVAEIIVLKGSEIARRVSRETRTTSAPVGWQERMGEGAR